MNMSVTTGRLALPSAKTIVVKLGSAVLTNASGNIDFPILEGICGDISRLVKAGKNVIVVTSGAVAAGRGIFHLSDKPSNIAEKQALAAVGQTRLMRIYSDIFEEEEIAVGQMLLSRGDMEDRRRYLNARYTLEELLRRRCVPIINENDTVTVDELRFGDNDGLAAVVAVKMQADALFLLSDVEGVFDSNPKHNPQAKLIEQIDRVSTSLIEQLCADSKAGSAIGSGGMYSKLMAARLATAAGVCVAISQGKETGIIAQIMRGEFKGTFFPAQACPHTRRRQWILSGKSASNRRVIIDDGAKTALVQSKKSLLSAGVKRIEGAFSPGDIVEILDSGGSILGRGIVNYSSTELERIRGHKSAEIESILGAKTYDEVIHRNNLALLQGA
jgi:glutamate 5-kinase